MNLIVKLVTTPTPLLTVTPDDEEISPGGTATLMWIRDTTGAEFQFSSTSVTGLPDPPFSTPSYSPTQNTISVTDTHLGASSQGNFGYNLSVTSGGTSYPSNERPVIVNR